MTGILQKIKEFKNLGSIIIGMLIFLSSIFLLLKDAYGWGVLCLFLLIILLKLDSLIDFTFSLTGGVRSKFQPPGVESKVILEGGGGRTENVALVSYKIASQLPHSVPFNLLEDWKVWFWIFNHGSKKYKAYVNIKFITDEIEKNVESGYYGGTQAWKLDSFTGIQAPGLDIPEEIRNSVQEGKRLKIQIKCKIHDENDIFVENKFPQTYVYNSDDNSWFLEP